MDKSDTLMIVLIIALLIVLVFEELGHRDTMDKLDVIEQRIEERTYLDSLYWDHLESCGFVSREDIKTDSRGYFYSQYLKKYGSAR